MYSDNIIFFDGEFKGLNPSGTEFLSMAFITIDEKELYLELEPPAIIDSWVKANVIPYMNQENKYNVGAAIILISDFIDAHYKEKPFLIADVNQFDWMGICGLFGIWNIPFHYIPIDFASILFQKGIDPDIDRINYARSLGIDVEKFKKHNSLDDCRVLKELYERI